MVEDIFDKVVNNMGPIGSHAHYSHHYYSFPKLSGELGPYMSFNGKRMLNWSLNNYLGLANHPEVREADAKASAEYGLAYPMGARMMTGNSELHEEFEKQLAEFVGKEDAFLLNYGYQGVMSVVESMVDFKDVVVYDAESHACLIDGVRLHRAKGGKTYTFKHNDMESLEKNLIRATKIAEEQGGGIMVITEGVFGMSGAVGSLDKIAELKKKYKFRLLVDDAHGFGTMGKTGAGVPEHFGVQDAVDLHFCTFAKSMAAIGAFIAAKKEIVMYLKYNMRSQTYAKALPMPFVLGGMKRLELIKKNPQLKDQLWTIVKALQDGFRSRGFDIGNTTSPVTPVLLQGDYDLPTVTNLIKDLRENMAIFCSIIVYPVVPKGVILLRVIPTAAHTLEDVEYTMNCFETVKKKLTEGSYKPA
ncbi:MAG: pyridoxal phosphate-dependent aminotransferase family protein [Leadbetterella sp.]|jgi:glycine C-acetyltransferase|uniref:aminotransferase class I/II-fold pyridoxal phosphate-dependent enzyme n=1 Tax=Lacihabitans sp. CCS-44 TaxID=2487331 RepID=UPI001B78B38C|nr:pyridoxal phosphate-dependent aminotransferase family protein [Lacihabitans sp. CCS-44]MBP8155928.1 pyridoxal phosphate-dependent aminotransferase family protein [Leadbetterella sp.]MCP9754094.1 pyridoxal phosphate-dependent aminotransferase family protein [Lacihabitans sp. CCS-44]